MHSFIVSLMVVLFTVVPVLAEQGRADAPRAKGLPMSVHGTASPETGKPNAEPGLAGALKKSKLSGYPSKTFGAAIDDYRYFTKREWRETPSTDGKTYVDFTGWIKKSLFDIRGIKDGISSRAVGIKFLVNPDGSYGAVMASRIELKSNGMLDSHPLDDLNGVMKKIYENKELGLK